MPPAFNSDGTIYVSKDLKIFSCKSPADKYFSLACLNSKLAFWLWTVVGVSPQETAVAPNLTAEENLRLMCGVHGLSREKTRERVRELCGEFALGDIMHRRAGKLSGGWQRRLSIAMALTGDPEILFLDEPTLGLDVIARSELWDVVRLLKGKKTIVLTTHYMEEAEMLSDRIGVMRGGRLLALGTAAELKAFAGKDRLEDAFVAIVKGEGK